MQKSILAIRCSLILTLETRFTTACLVQSSNKGIESGCCEPISGQSSYSLIYDSKCDTADVSDVNFQRYKKNSLAGKLLFKLTTPPIIPLYLALQIIRGKTIYNSNLFDYIEVFYIHTAFHNCHPVMFLRVNMEIHIHS